MAYQEYGVSELNIFAPQPLQSEVVKCENIYYSPVTSLTNATTIEFAVPASPDHYIDLNSILLSLKLQFLKPNGASYFEKIEKLATDNTKVDPDKSKDLFINQPSFVANPLHAIFRSVTVFMNNKQVRFVDHLGFKDYITKVLNYDSESLKTMLINEGFIKDTAGKEMEGISPDNYGMNSRRNIVFDSNICEIMGLIQVDICKQARFLLPNIGLKFVFNMENPDFFIMEPTTNASQLRIHDASLRVKQFTVHPKLHMAHHQLLNKGSSGVYPFKKTEIKTFTIATGMRGSSIENVYTGVLPTALVVGLVSNTSFTGSRERNPYYFHHYNVSSIGVYVNGLCVTQTPIETAYNDYLYGRAYHQLYEGTGKLFSTD